MSITDLLQPIKDRLNAATPGPWFAHQEYIDMGVPDAQHTITDSPNRYDGKFIAAVGLHSDVKHANSDLIRYAPTDQAKLIAAIEKVAGLHKPERGVVHDPDDGETKEMDYCETCSDSPWLDEASAVAWPCPTVAALAQALGGDTA